MCKFFSAISKDERVLFFKVEDIAKILSEGNPKNYELNSHTSIGHYHGVTADDESNWSFWEYDKDSKELKIDKGTDKDKDVVKKAIEDYLSNKNVSCHIRNWLLTGS